MQNHPVRNSLLILAILASLSQTAHAGYMVIDDELFTYTAVPISIALRMNPPLSVAKVTGVQHEATTTIRRKSINTFSIMFKKDSAVLPDRSSEALSTLLPLMDNKYIAITGRPDQRKNQLLAQNRAKAIRIWLLRQGFASDRIQITINNNPVALVDAESPSEIQILDAWHQSNISSSTDVSVQRVAATTLLMKLDARLEMLKVAAQASQVDTASAIAMIDALLNTQSSSLISAIQVTPIQKQAKTQPITETPEELQLPGTDLPGTTTAVSPVIDAELATALSPLPSQVQEVVPTPALERWKIDKGENISTAIGRWSQNTNKWKLAWEAPDLVADRDISLEGLSFEDAVEKVIDALNNNGAGMVARFYSLNQTNHVLRIMEKK